MNEAFLAGRDIRKTYVIERTSIEVLKGVSVSVDRGETMAITGPSGAGKSTLLHVLGGLDLPTAGNVTFQGENVYELSGARRTQMRADKFGFVFQMFHLLPELDIVENVSLPALAKGGRSPAEVKAHALELLDKVGLGHRARHRPLELSGGEQQRVAIARALMNEPEVVLADEPTGNLDSKTGQVVLDYLFDLTRGRGHTLLLVTHNEAVAEMCSRRLRLKDGTLE